MAVASLAAILKPQILCLMQGNREEKLGKKTVWPSGHVDTMWHRLEDGSNNLKMKTEETFPPSISSKPSSSLSLLTTSTCSASLYTAQTIASFFHTCKILRNAVLAIQSIPGHLVGIRSSFSFYIKFSFMLAIFTHETPPSSSSAKLISFCTCTYKMCLPLSPWLKSLDPLLP